MNTTVSIHADSTISADSARRIYRNMARIKACNDRIEMSLQAGVMSFQYYPCGGQEAIPATICELLRPDDLMVTTYRGLHDILAKGSPMREVIAEMSGKVTGTSKGKGGAMHLSDPNSGLMVTTGIVGAGLPIANGLALAEKLKGSGRVVICNFGDGAANIGTFNESLNLASLWNLPVIFVCQNNLYAEYTSFADSTRSTAIADRAAGYGMPGVRVDGTDPDRIHESAADAIARARSGGGPTLLECVAYRLQGHSFGSEEAHMDAIELAAARSDPPIAKYRRKILASGIVDEAALADIDRGVEDEIDDAFDFAEQSQSPDADELYIDIFADKAGVPDFYEPTPVVPVTVPRPSRQMTMGQAINDALDIALSSDPKIILLGEDIGDPAGGVGKATIGLSSKHGADRVRSTPISESAIVGAAIGASLAGFKPMAEVMICDFAMVCMDQIANHAAKLRYMSGGRTSVPITLRMMSAANVGSFGAQHSQSLEAWFAHSPGLKIVAPSNAYDAKGLLLSCLDDPDPCIYIEALKDYFTAGEVPEGDYRIPLGQAKIVSEGDDITLISYSWTMTETRAAAELLRKQGVSVEVIDLRSIVPLDMETVLASVSKTRRAIIVHAAVEFCGFGAEIASRLQEKLFGNLKAPIGRVGARYTPVPFASGLESLHFPNAERVRNEAMKLLDR